MIQVNDPHPHRIWRHDKNLDKKLQALRDLMARSRRKYGPPVNGIQFMERPLAIDPRMVESFQDLQALLYKHNDATHFEDSFLKFWDDHRQIFVFNATIAEAFSQTDVGDVPWEELRLPHPEFHLSLGDYGQRSFVIGDLEYVLDGAYVRKVDKSSLLFPNDSILFTFTARLVFPSYQEAREMRASKGFYFAEPVYDYCVSGAGCHTLGEAIERGGAEYAALCDRHDFMQWESAREVASEFDVLPIGRPINAVRGKFERSKEMILEAVPTLFNAIFYLTACPENREEGFSNSAPRDLVQSHRHTMNQEIKASIERSLAKKGFSKIIFVCDHELKVDAPSMPTGRHVRAHWRRGHWRNQPFGEGLTQRRWRWIKPVLVKKEDEFKIGAIHEVRKSPPYE